MPVAYNGTVTGRLGYSQAGSDQRSYAFVVYNGCFTNSSRFFQKGAGATSGSEAAAGLVGVATQPFYVRHNGSNVQTAAHKSATTQIANGTRTHVVITHDQSSGTLTAPKMYLNGTLVVLTVLTVSAGVAQDNTAPFYIGNSDTGANPLSSANAEPLGEFMLWDNVILTQMEVTALWNGVCPLLIRPAQLRTYVPQSSFNSTTVQLFRDYVAGNGAVSYPNGNPNAISSSSFPFRLMSKVAQMAQVN